MHRSTTDWKHCRDGRSAVLTTGANAGTVLDLTNPSTYRGHRPQAPRSPADTGRRSVHPGHHRNRSAGPAMSNTSNGDHDLPATPAKAKQELERARKSQMRSGPRSVMR